MKIFINPGHKIGREPGACHNGLREAEVVMNIAKRVEGYLTAVGYEVKLAQIDGLQAIADASNDYGADLFVSIHANSVGEASDALRARGVETYSYSGATQGARLAEKIQARLVDRFPELPDRGTKTAAYTVLARTIAPAVLVETAFISNPEDAKLLVDREDDFARAIACGITDYVAAMNPSPDAVTADAPKEYADNPAMLSAHFEAGEFACHCCGRTIKMHPALIENLEKLRAAIGKPLEITSGYRCPAHNAEVGGVPNSQHVQGTAADVAQPSGVSFNDFADAVERQNFDGVGFYPHSGFIHVDVRSGGVNAGIRW